MRRQITQQGLRRAARECAAAEDRREAAARGLETRSRNASTPPSELDALSRWRETPEADWTGRDALGCYASAYRESAGEEDPELKSAAARERGSAILLRVIRECAGAGESPREFLQWAVPEALSGKRWPQDGVASPGTMVTGWILLKRWRAKRRKQGSGAGRRGNDWEEG